MRSRARMGALSAAVVAVAACATGAIAGGAAAPAPPGYKLIGTFGKIGTGPGQFASTVHGIAVDKAGNVYVADTDNNRIQVFTASGKFLRAWGSVGGETGQFQVAEDVDVAPDGTVWVADQQNERLQGFSAAGAFIASIPVPGELPRAIAVDKDGNVLAAENGDAVSIVRKYAKTASGGWEPSGEAFASAPYRIDDVDVAPDGTIFVTTANSQVPYDARVRHYTADGKALGSFKTPQGDETRGIGIDPDCNVWGPESAQRRIVKYSPSGSVLATAASPDLVANDIAIGPKGDVYAIHQNTGITHFAEDRSKPAAAAVPARLVATKKVVKVAFALTGVACPAQIDATASLKGRGISGKATVQVAAGKTTVITIPLAKAASGPAMFTIVLKTNGRPTTQTRAVTLVAR
jgi:sugar lactone lactonase YvrE